MNEIATSFGTRLRWWRQRRGLSQLDLALGAETTQRHLSFLESARATPSREMVLRLAAALDLPLRQQNALLLAAGYAPRWRESDLSAPALARVNDALDYMLAQQEPYPAFVVDRRWNLLRANEGAARLTEFLTGPRAAVAAPAEPVNLAIALMSPDGLRPFIVNWPETADLLRRLLAFPGLPAVTTVLPATDEDPPVVAIHFRRGETSLRLFTTIATLGTPQDVTLSEIRIECFFPEDEATARVFRDWATRSDAKAAAYSLTGN